MVSYANIVERSFKSISTMRGIHQGKIITQSESHHALRSRENGAHSDLAVALSSLNSDILRQKRMLNSRN